MFKILIAVLFSMFLYEPVSIYTFQVPSANGGTINFSQFEGKRVLIVNIATQSEFASQLSELQQLQQSYSNDLVIVAFPSNSFGNEPLSNDSIASYLSSQYNISFPVGAKVEVNDTTGNIAPLYRWLTTRNENGVLNRKIRGDFEKFLVNKEGILVGYFDGTITPASQSIENALQVHQ